VKKTDSKEVLPLTHGAINETTFGCTNVQTADMDIIGTGGILIAALQEKAVARALTINSIN